jgi:hypothetical protein
MGAMRLSQLLSIRQSGARIIVTFLDNETLDLVLAETIRSHPMFTSPDYMWLSGVCHVAPALAIGLFLGSFFQPCWVVSRAVPYIRVHVVRRPAVTEDCSGRMLIAPSTPPSIRRLGDDHAGTIPTRRCRCVPAMPCTQLGHVTDCVYPARAPPPHLFLCVCAGMGCGWAGAELVSYEKGNISWPPPAPWASLGVCQHCLA